jgi:diacylglycerol kinase family enzyme
MTGCIRGTVLILTFRTAHLIYNPNAGALIRRRHRFDRAVETLRNQGLEITLVPTNAPGHATGITAEIIMSGSELVIAAGGDGTVNEVLNGMAGSRVPLAVLPCGTANVLACETGLGTDPLDAASQFADLEPCRIATGLIRPTSAPPRHFLLMAGAGLDAEVIRHVDLSFKRRWGKLAYWRAGLSLFGRTLSVLRCSDGNGNSRETSFALAARVRNYGGDLVIAAGANLLSNEFEVVTFAGSSTISYALYLAGAIFGQARRIPGVSMFRATKLACSAIDAAAIGVQVDGEPAGQLPATVETVPDALTLMLPRRFVRRGKSPG